MAASRTQLGLSHQENALNFDMERLGFQLWAQPNQELIVRRIQSAFVSGLCSLHVDFILTLRFNKLANHLGLEVKEKRECLFPVGLGQVPGFVLIGPPWVMWLPLHKSLIGQA